MGPPEWRDMGQKLWRAVDACPFALRDGTTKVVCIPVDGDGGEKVETGPAFRLRFHFYLNFPDKPDFEKKL